MKPTISQEIVSQGERLMLKIQSIESFVRGERIGLVRVRTEAGEEGWGQFAPSNADITALVLHRQVAPVALGMDASDPEAISDAVMAATYKFPGTYVCRALAGLDPISFRELMSVARWRVWIRRYGICAAKWRARVSVSC
jgi:hypothetical protein